MNAPDVIEGDYTETTAIAIRPDQTPAPSSLFAAMRPAEKIALATEIATVMRGVLEAGKPGIDARGKPCRAPLITRVPQKQKGEIVGYSEHVHAEGWQTLGTLCGVSARVVSTTKIENGYEARAEVVRIENGVVIGAGEATCTKEESRGPWKYADDYAIKSMAQTRAVSKALRGVLAWVIVLAGYSPTPADEVPPGGFDHSPLASPAPTPQPPKITTAELVALAHRKGVELGPWLEKHIAPDLARRPKKTLSTEESDRAKHALEALPDPKPRDPSEPQRSLLFALHSQLRHNDGDRHLIYKRIAGKTSSKDLTAGDISRVIDYLNTLTEGS